MIEKPINEEKYIRIELPEELQRVFTGLMSGSGQVVINGKVRSGKATSEEYKINPHDKVELKIIAIYRLEEEENGK